MEVTTIMWRTSSEELPLIIRAIEHEIQRMEDRASVSSGHIDKDLLPPDYQPLLKVYNQLIRHM